MERGLEVPEQSQGDAVQGVQPGPVEPGEEGATADVAAPEQAEAAARDTAEATVVEAAADAPGPEPVAAADPVPAGVTVDDGSEAEADAVEAAAPADDQPVPVSGAPRKRMLMGNVVSDKGDRTIVVSIARRKKHRLYKKYITLTRKLKAHDPDNECRVGDLVRVVESRPLSREKRWRLVEVVKRAG